MGCGDAIRAMPPGRHPNMVLRLVGAMDGGELHLLHLRDELRQGDLLAACGQDMALGGSALRAEGDGQREAATGAMRTSDVDHLRPTRRRQRQRM